MFERIKTKHEKKKPIKLAIKEGETLEFKNCQFYPPLDMPPRDWLDYLEWRVTKLRDDFEMYKTKAAFEEWRTWLDVYRKALAEDAPEDPRPLVVVPIKAKDGGIW